MIDLCIVSYNNLHQLPRLITVLTDSLQLHPFIDWRLRIADNGSTDGCREYLDVVKDELYIDTVHFNENVGYAKACNDLAASGDADIIALLNADVWFTVKDLHMIQLQFEQEPEMAVLGPKQRSEHGRITHAGIFGTNEAPKHRGWQQEDLNDELYRDRLPAVTVSGSAYFVRRSAWEEMTRCEVFQKVFPGTVGAFGPFKHYYEETLLSYHITNHYGPNSVIYDGRISIGHTWHGSHQIGSPMDHQFEPSREGFRRFCDAHGILHD